MRVPGSNGIRRSDVLITTCETPSAAARWSAASVIAACQANLQSGEQADHDDQGQNTHIARDGIKHTAKSHVMSATEGSKPLTTFEVNDQMKGSGARLDQLERNLHGLFDVTSRLRQIVQTQIPAAAALASILSQSPQGLVQMEQAIAGGQAQAYLQQQISQALDKFLSPSILSVSSVLSGGIERLISAATAEIASLVSANLIIATVDSLVDELACVMLLLTHASSKM